MSPVAPDAGFSQFFSSEYPKVWRSLALALGDPTSAEDVAQDAFARALRRWRSVRRMDRPGTWVYVVALRAHRRAMWRDSRIVTGIDGVDTEEADPIRSSTRSMWVANGLATLSPRQRCAVVLRYYADLPVADIAAAMGCAPGTVKATLHSALTKLRVSLEPEEVSNAH